MNTLSSLFVAAVVIATSAIPVSASRPDLPELPQQAGVYETGRPGEMLRVFVHKAKPAPTAPTLTCNLSDPDSATVVPGAGWHLPSSWSYVVNAESAPATVGAANVGTIVSNAFAVWQAQVPSVTVTNGGSTSLTRAARDNRNIITWGRTSGSALAVTYIWYTNGVAQETDTIFNKTFRWYWSTQADCAYNGVYDAQDILTHELGHTYGLDDTYTAAYADNTMYGYGSTGEVKKDTLTSGDIEGVQSLY